VVKFYFVVEKTLATDLTRVIITSNYSHLDFKRNIPSTTARFSGFRITLHACMGGCARLFDIAGKYWVDVDTKKDIERAKKLLAEYSQKKCGASDFVGHYLNRPIENKIVYLISDSQITPNEVAIFTNVLAYVVTALFFFGHLLAGVILTFVVGIVDGLDARMLTKTFTNIGM